MGLEKDFLSMTSDTVTVAQATTMSKYGAPTFGSPSTAIPARIEFETRRVIDSEGVERISSGMVFVLSTTAVVTPQTRMTLPNGDTPEIMRVDILNDEFGQHHLEISFR